MNEKRSARLSFHEELLSGDCIVSLFQWRLDTTQLVLGHYCATCLRRSTLRERRRIKVFLHDVSFQINRFFFHLLLLFRMRAFGMCLCIPGYATLTIFEYIDAYDSVLCMF